MNTGPDDNDAYVVSHLRELLADEGELHVDVTVSGGRVVLGGHVATEERRTGCTDLVRRAAPDREVHNQIEVVSPEGQPKVEELS